MLSISLIHSMSFANLFLICWRMINDVPFIASAGISASILRQVASFICAFIDHSIVNFVTCIWKITIYCYFV